MIDWPARLTTFRMINGGWYQGKNSLDVNVHRRIFPTLLTSAVTSWISVPFELARMAYYGDKTFPKEL